jgi:hypothetical protein
VGPNDLEEVEVEALTAKTRAYFVSGGFVGIDIVRTEMSDSGPQTVRTTATYEPSEAIKLAQGVMQLATAIMGPAEALKVLMSPDVLAKLADIAPPMDPDLGITDGD